MGLCRTGESGIGRLGGFNRKWEHRLLGIDHVGDGVECCVDSRIGQLRCSKGYGNLPALLHNSHDLAGHSWCNAVRVLGRCQLRCGLPSYLCVSGLMCGLTRIWCGRPRKIKREGVCWLECDLDRILGFTIYKPELSYTSQQAFFFSVQRRIRFLQHFPLVPSC